LSCSNPLDRPYNEKTFSEDAAQITEAVDTTDAAPDRRDLFCASMEEVSNCALTFWINHTYIRRRKPCTIHQVPIAT
jgi:hypothetical protein